MSDYTSAIIGHVTLDTNTDHLGNTVQIVGGAVIYSSAAAHALGHRVAAVTKFAPKDADRLAQFTIPKEDIFCLPSAHSTDLVNIYHTADKERRTCACRSKGDPFTVAELPDLDAQIYHLAGLVYGDFNPEIIKELAKKAPVALDVQACLRHVADDGSMFFADWSDKLTCLPYITYLKTDAAEAEIMTGTDDRRLAAKQLYAWGAKEIMITHNTEVLAYDGKDFYVCPIRARNLSGRTGRGDTTFAAYINERLTRSIPEALLTATATVSLKMETPGPFRGTRADVEAYIDAFYPEFR
ncbi:MAG: ribokinase [Clostridia bacterium]|nr:ribokinase [Clostridia bacterium]